MRVRARVRVGKSISIYRYTMGERHLDIHICGIYRCIKYRYVAIYISASLYLHAYDRCSCRPPVRTVSGPVPSDTFFHSLRSAPAVPCRECPRQAQRLVVPPPQTSSVPPAVSTLVPPAAEKSSTPLPPACPPAHCEYSITPLPPARPISAPPAAERR